MRSWNEQDVENLIRGSEFPNPAHKESLRSRLFEDGVELDMDELGAVAGGIVTLVPEGDPFDPLDPLDPLDPAGIERRRRR